MQSQCTCDLPMASNPRIGITFFRTIIMMTRMNPIMMTRMNSGMVLGWSLWKAVRTSEGAKLMHLWSPNGFKSKNSFIIGPPQNFGMDWQRFENVKRNSLLWFDLKLSYWRILDGGLELSLIKAMWQPTAGCFWCFFSQNVHFSSYEFRPLFEFRRGSVSWN